MDTTLPSDPRFTLRQEKQKAVLDDLVVSLDTLSCDEVKPPEPEPLPDRPAVKAFHPDYLPEVLQAFCEDVCERMQAPLDFVAVGLVVSLGATLGRKIAVRPKAVDDWCEVPNLWGGIVGRSGLLKTPALAASLTPFRQLEARALRDFEDQAVQTRADELKREAQIKALRKEVDASEGQDEDAAAMRLAQLEMESEVKVTQHRYETNDATIEKIGELLQENPNGLMIFRDELTGWFRSLDKDGHEMDRAFYLESANGKNGFTNDRIGRGTTRVPSCCLSILGGIQPGPLEDYIRQALNQGKGNDGLLQRFQILVWPDDPSSWENVDRAPDTAACEKVFNVFKNLDAMTTAQMQARPDDDFPYLRFSGAAQEMFNEWRAGHEKTLHTEHECLESHFAKYRKLIPTLALILHLADGGVGDITDTALARALMWGDYLETHARRIYSDFDRQDIAAARKLISRLPSLPDNFTAKTIYDKGWAGLGRRAIVIDGLGVLRDYNWVTSVVAETGGRPTEIWTPHPSLREGKRPQ